MMGREIIQIWYKYIIIDIKNKELVCLNIFDNRKLFKYKNWTKMSNKTQFYLTQ